MKNAECVCILHSAFQVSIRIPIERELDLHPFAPRDIAWLGSYGKGNDLLPLLGLPHDELNVS